MGDLVEVDDSAAEIFGEGARGAVDVQAYADEVYVVEAFAE